MLVLYLTDYFLWKRVLLETLKLYLTVTEEEGNGTRSAQKCGPGGKRRVENCGQILSQPARQATEQR